jgi:D-alanyl-D-alanine carboxypeptidase
LLIACLNLRPACAEPVEIDAARAATIDTVVQEWLNSTEAPSVSIALIEHDHIVYLKAYGTATTSTRYAIDSVTKEFTAAAVLLLAQQGNLSLDDAVRKWFPALGGAATVTLRQLLTHTSGIRDYWPQDFLTRDMMRPTTSAALLQKWAQPTLDFTPGSDWQYSNTNYVLAAAVVEKVSGESLFEFLKHSIFAPLRMTGVFDYDDGATLSSGDAAGYTRNGLGPVRPAAREGAGWLTGAANLAMSPRDLASWDLSLINRSLLNEYSYAQQFAPIMLSSGRTEPYGLGLEVSQSSAGAVVAHSGLGSGFQTDNRVWLAEKRAIVVMSNNDWATPADLSERLAFAMAPAKEILPVAALFQSLQNGVIDRAQFTEIGNFFLTPAVLEEIHISLAPLGPARSIKLEEQSRRGGLIMRRWKIICAAARLEVIERSRPDGKVEEFRITRRQD